MPAPILPTEVWRSILRDATHVPFLLEAEWNWDPDAYIWTGWDSPSMGPTIVDVEVPNAEATKQAIIRVCRQWWALGAEFLYEAVTLPDDAPQIDKFIETIRQSQSSSTIGYGWWIKRIQWAPHGRGSYFENVSILLNHCPNLKILLVKRWAAIGYKDQVLLAQLLQSVVSASLKRLDFIVDFREDDGSVQINNVLPNFHLHSLSLTIGEPNLLEPLSLDFGAISTLVLVVQRLTAALPNWSFPNLRSLSVFHFEEDEIPSLVSLVERHRQTLKCLHLHPLGPQCDTNTLLSVAPNLISLSTTHGHFRWFATVTDGGLSRQYPSITHIGIYRSPSSRYIPPSRDAMEHMMERRMFPGLKIIRLTCGTAADDISAWEELGVLFQRYGVRLEDMYNRHLC